MFSEVTGVKGKLQNIHICYGVVSNIRVWVVTGVRNSYRFEGVFTGVKQTRFSWFILSFV